MGEQTTIEWADHTFNPWEGCQKVGPGCDHCYAEVRNARFGGGTAPNWGPWAPRRRTSGANWHKPVRWNNDARTFQQEHGRRQRVFCASLADVFDNAVDDQWRCDLGDLIERTPDLDWMLLTKRISNAPEMLRLLFPLGIPDHVWIGATIVNQEEAYRDIPKLLDVPARVLFLSMEPLLGSIDLNFMASRDGTIARAILLLDWVIAGGESGPGARPMHPDWARSLRDQCAAAGVAFHFKQWGEWSPLRDYAGSGYWPAAGGGCIRLTKEGERADAGYPLQRVGKKRAGRLLDGRTHDGFPDATR